MVNISTRLVNHAIKALQNGCDDLIAAVDAGWLAVSTASVLAGRTPEDQKAALIAGPRFAAFMARRARAEKRPAASSPAGQFRVMQAAESNDWLFLCIQANCLNAAIRALEARGFQRITG